MTWKPVVNGTREERLANLEDFTARWDALTVREFNEGLMEVGVSILANPAYEGDCTMRALIIKKPWIDLILSGEKTWEIRGSHTSIRERIYLAESGTGMLVGEVELWDCMPIHHGLMFSDVYRAHHCIPAGKTIPYESPYAWILRDAIRFETPIPYKHPQGAVIWVKDIESRITIKEEKQ